MVTTKNADNALKTFYLDAVAKSIDMKTNPFLAQIERTSVGVSGKEVRKLVRVGVNGAVGVGSETGDLPKSRDSQYVQYVAPLKNIYGTIEISDKALRASQSDEGALVNLLNTEMEGLVESAKYQFDRMLFGNGNSYLTTILSFDGNVATVESTAPLAEGMVVTFSSMGVTVKDVVIQKVDRIAQSITFDESVDVSKFTSTVAVYANYDMPELLGLEALFENSTLYGLKKAEHPFMKSYCVEGVEDFSEDVLLRVMDRLEEMSGRKINMILCSWGVRRAIEYYFNGMGAPLPVEDLGNGFKVLTYKGIPIVPNRFCAKGTMYLVNTDDFKLCQLCDWQWLEGEDGTILRQVPGKPVYTATLVKYAELICERPNGQGKITGIVED